MSKYLHFFDAFTRIYTISTLPSEKYISLFLLLYHYTSMLKRIRYYASLEDTDTAKADSRQKQQQCVWQLPLFWSWMLLPRAIPYKCISPVITLNNGPLRVFIRESFLISRVRHLSLVCAMPCRNYVISKH